MPLPPHLEAKIAEVYIQPDLAKGPAVKRGDEIFDGTDYPREWADFVGQEEAVARLRAAVNSAVGRRARVDHILLASGLHGIGKTTLAMLVAAKIGGGLVQVSGSMSVEEARKVLRGMSDRDVLFWDEIHMAVAGNKNKADWILPLLTDGVLMTSRGAEPMPDVTIIGATTDLGKLPQTVISRFMVRPELVAYTPEQGVALVNNLSQRMHVPVEPEHRSQIARAASNNPRNMRMILTAVRDLSYVSTPVDMDKALRWSGFTRDGLTSVAVDILLVLLGQPDHKAGLDSIQAQLGEPGPLRHHEQALLQRGLIHITGRGRELSDEGMLRAIEALNDRSS